MRSRAPRIWEYGDYWIGRVAGSDYLYACWWDKRAGKTRRRSLATKVLAEAQDCLIKLAGSSRTNASRSPDAVLLMAALDFYYENDVKLKPSAKPAFRAMQLLAEYISEKIGPDARVSAFAKLRQRDFMRWCVEKHQHSAGTIARNLSVYSAALRYCCKPQIVRDGFGNEIERLLLDSAPAVYTQPKEVARLTELPESSPREWIPTFEEFGRFIDAIDARSKEQRDVWLGHNDGRTADWYEHRDPEFVEDARRATDQIIEELQLHTRRPLSARKLRAKASIQLVHSKKESI